MALLNGSTRVATVTATEPMSLISFSALEFTTLLGSLPPSVARRMLAGVTARLRDADHRAVPMTADRVGQQPVDVGARSSPAS
jgi:CRP-like cAMP-binding protein